MRCKHALGDILNAFSELSANRRAREHAPTSLPSAVVAMLKNGYSASNPPPAQLMIAAGSLLAKFQVGRPSHDSGPSVFDNWTSVLVALEEFD